MFGIGIKRHDKINGKNQQILHLGKILMSMQKQVKKHCNSRVTKEKQSHCGKKLKVLPWMIGLNYVVILMLYVMLVDGLNFVMMKLLPYIIIMNHHMNHHGKNQQFF